MAQTRGRVTGIRLNGTETTATATGAAATHVEAANEDGVSVRAMVKPTGDSLTATAGILVNGRWLGEIALHEDGHISFYDMSGRTDTVVLS